MKEAVKKKLAPESLCYYHPMSLSYKGKVEAIVMNVKKNSSQVSLSDGELSYFFLSVREHK